MYTIINNLLIEAKNMVQMSGFYFYGRHNSAEITAVLVPKAISYNSYTVTVTLVTTLAWLAFF